MSGQFKRIVVKFCADFLIRFVANYKIIIQYDGTDYSGWQIQKNAVTVQQILTEKISLILRKKDLTITGSGRTDAGVHSLGQTANFKTDIIKDIGKFMHSLNSILPKDISVNSLEEVPEEFNARFSAKKRSYFYILNFTKSPFYEKYTWYDSRFENIDIEKLNRAAKILKGNNDFTSFSRKDEEKMNKNCEIFEASWRKKGNLVLFYIEANRFLRGMVRAITGTMLKAVNQDEPGKYIKNILEAADRSSADESVPAKGLFLYKVKY